MGEVLAVWHKREDGQHSTRWLLDDLWRAACSILSAQEAGAIQQWKVAEYHHQQARESLKSYNAAQEVG